MNIAGYYQTVVTWLERAAGGIVELIIAGHEGDAITRANITVHLPRDYQDTCETTQQIDDE